MKKDFDEWNEQKKSIDSKDSNIFFKEGDVWWASLGINIGQETIGKGKSFKRPVVVLKKLTRFGCIVMPLTSNMKDGTWYFKITFNAQVSNVMLHQIRMMSTKRFESRIAVLSTVEFLELKNAVAKFYNIL